VSGVAILLLAYLVFLIFKPFAVALVFAAVMAVVFHPLQVWFERRMPRSWASFASTTVVVAVIIVPAFASPRHMAKPLDWVSTSTRWFGMRRSGRRARPDSWRRAS
jgi:hypothetical protein